jgi:pimeloyl-ACP methyl ester carboxylesterase
MGHLHLAFWFLAGCSSFATGGSGAPSARQEFDKVVALDGDRHIALHCRGGGRFTVLLETGDGGRRAHMTPLFEALSKRYRVCDYDRRNIGQSSAAPTPRKAGDLASDAFDALAAAREHGPYILFGTSMGGLLVRSYAATHRVRGFVTSNQPGTTREWAPRAYPVMSSSERKADEAWAAGDNREHIDVNDVSHTIEAASPPSEPYMIMASTERFQCSATGVCGPLYQAYLAGSRQAASAGPLGRFELLDGNHDLYVTNLDQVVAAIDAVAAAATTHK